jgi:hypothetical protein
MVGYEFKAVQPDGVETILRVPTIDLSFPDLMEHIESFLIAVGFHRDTINRYFEANAIEGEAP